MRKFVLAAAVLVVVCGAAKADAYDDWCYWEPVMNNAQSNAYDVKAQASSDLGLATLGFDTLVATHEEKRAAIALINSEVNDILDGLRSAAAAAIWTATEYYDTYSTNCVSEYAAGETAKSYQFQYVTGTGVGTGGGANYVLGAYYAHTAYDKYVSSQELGWLSIGHSGDAQTYLAAMSDILSNY